MRPSLTRAAADDRAKCRDRGRCALRSILATLAITSNKAIIITPGGRAAAPVTPETAGAGHQFPQGGEGSATRFLLGPQECRRARLPRLRHLRSG